MVPRKDMIEIRHARIRKRISGRTEVPRLAVHFSGRHIYAQIIDDSVGRTLTSVNTTEPLLRHGARSNMATAKAVGELVGQRAKQLNIGRIVFDRGGFLYHGKVRALANAVRETGIAF